MHLGLFEFGADSGVRLPVVNGVWVGADCEREVGGEGDKAEEMFGEGLGDGGGGEGVEEEEGGAEGCYCFVDGLRVGGSVRGEGVDGVGPVALAGEAWGDGISSILLLGGVWDRNGGCTVVIEHLEIHFLELLLLIGRRAEEFAAENVDVEYFADDAVDEPDTPFVEKIFPC